LLTIPKEAENIISQLETHGFEAYLVGGCVRDLILGLEAKDFDICTSALPSDVCRLFTKTLKTGIKHGTVTVIKNGIPFEVSTFRIDMEYTDHRRPDKVLFSRSLTEDLKRRDFTINAICYHPKKGIIDPFNGMKDINGKLIRTVGNPVERFSEDALRMLRAVRFKASLGFEIEPATKNAILQMSSTISHISRERILYELNGILSGSSPGAFEILFDTGLINYIFPVPVPVKYQLKPLKSLPDKLPLRWAAAFRLMGFTDLNEVKVICDYLRMSNKLKNYVLNVMKILNDPLPENRFILKKTLSDTGIEIFSDSLKILRASGFDTNKTNALELMLNDIYSNNECVNRSALAIKGRDLIENGFIPGKQLGVIIELLFLCVLQIPELNSKDLLIEIAEIVQKTFPHDINAPGLCIHSFYDRFL
jgi:tRNA nucleotidyltransferase (CCA-adding enzyme)